MNFHDFLLKKKRFFLEMWLDSILRTYSPEAVDFFKKSKDIFSNPVGVTIKDEIDKIFESLLVEDFSLKKVSVFLERIVRIRAVQDFTSIQALGFIFDLKRFIYEALEKANLLLDKEVRNSFFSYERRLDSLMLEGVAIYVTCRQQLCDFKIKEVERTYAKVLKRSGVYFGGLG